MLSLATFPLKASVALALAAASPAHAAQFGVASWYGRHWAGRKTASGERFNPHAMTAAHRFLPLGSMVKVTNLETGRSLLVKVNDRGPYVKGRVLDLSEGAAHELGVGNKGLMRVALEQR